LIATHSMAQPPSISSAVTSSRVAFDITSVKKTPAGYLGPGLPHWSTGGRLTVRGTTLRQLVVGAYAKYSFENVVGGPAWISSTRFDIDAVLANPKMGETDEQRRQALRTLLEDRFRLSMRHEFRDAPVYVLVKARKDGHLGPGLRVSRLSCADRSRTSATVEFARPSTPPKSNTSPACGFSGSPGFLSAGDAPIEVLRAVLASNADRPIVDRTALTGKYDILLTYSPAQGFQPTADVAASGQDGPLVFTAIQEQLGLRLEPTHAPVDFFVITQAEEPMPSSHGNR